MGINPRLLESAERAWDSEMYSTKLALTRQVRQRYDTSGLAGLKRRARVLSRNPRRHPRELAELYALHDAITTFTRR